ncbi:MAG: NAD(P)/FAD-dependent oxidoreductase [Paludibacteraceae bacterium]|nr:NAD(P)/FAD-dependent oxidoreductase [Paludibacteraceae bacterium]
MKHIVVIGAGLGGLEVAYLCAKRGDKVTVFERGLQPGGCLQTFCRDGQVFETGFHIVGGLTKGSILYHRFADLDMLDLPWQEVGCQEVFLGENHYSLPCGEKAFQRALNDYFPQSEQEIAAYMSEIREIALSSAETAVHYWKQSAYEWLSRTISNPQLQQLLASTSLLMEMDKDSLSLFEYAEIMYGFVCSVYRLNGGGKTLVNHLVSGIRHMGGEVLCNRSVIGLLEHERQVIGVQLESGETMDADEVVSSLHPALTMSLLADNTMMRSVYRRRLSELKNTQGIFTVNIRLRKDVLQTSACPVYVHRENSNCWQTTGTSVDHVMLYFYSNGEALDILTPLAWSKVSSWQGTRQGHRGENYLHLKHSLAEECVSLACKVEPQLRDAIIEYWTSTPLSWTSYTASPEGAAFGTRKDYHAIDTSLLSPRTPLNGLFLTGQSLALHGIMGTTMAAFETMKYL